MDQVLQWDDATIATAVVWLQERSGAAKEDEDDSWPDTEED